MPLTGFEFAIAVAIIIGLSFAVVLMNKWRRRAGWWLLVAVVALIITGNVVEKATTGTSALF